jgi:hypothetical protein
MSKSAPMLVSVQVVPPSVDCRNQVLVVTGLAAVGLAGSVSWRKSW